ncbi:glycosyltransferase [Thiotrichales bacterium 19X7-9]|nr:glycosyltransferase [Thiotrichales bacterium 19X7-9]
MIKDKIDQEHISFDYRDHIMSMEHVQSICIKAALIENPVVSIVIPTYKRLHHLILAIESALNQLYIDNYEVIIVDNNPQRDCDVEKYIVAKYGNEKKVGYYKNEKNLGMFGNWNRCYKLAKAPWVSMLHDDDLLKDIYLSEMLKYIKMDEVVLIGNCPDKLFNVGKIRPKSRSRKIVATVIKWVGVRLFRGKYVKLNLYDFIFGVPIRPVGFMVKKSAIFHIGGFGNHSYVEDYLCFIKMYLKNKGQVKVLDSSLSFYRYSVNQSLEKATQMQFQIYNYYIRCNLIDMLDNKFLKKCLRHYNLVNYQRSTNSDKWCFAYWYSKLWIIIIYFYQPYLLDKTVIDMEHQNGI